MCVRPSCKSLVSLSRPVCSSENETLIVYSNPYPLVAVLLTIKLVLGHVLSIEYSDVSHRKANVVTSPIKVKVCRSEEMIYFSSDNLLQIILKSN